MSDDENKIKIDTEPAKKSIKELKKELKGLRDELVNLEEGTEEYNQKLREAGDIQHEIKEVTENIGRSAQDLGDQIGNATNAAAGLVGGFQAAQAVMGLFGVESENVGKAIQKMQQMMALTQGLSAIDNGIKSFKSLAQAVKSTTLVTRLFNKANKETAVSTNSAKVGVTGLAAGMTADATATGAATTATHAFKAALISTGIGAILVGIGTGIAYVVENWEKLTSLFGGDDSISKRAQTMDELAEVQERYIKSTEMENNHAIAMAKARGESAEEVAKKEIAAQEDLARKKKEFAEQEKANLEFIRNYRQKMINAGYDEDDINENVAKAIQSRLGETVEEDSTAIAEFLDTVTKKVEEYGDAAKQAAYKLEEMNASFDTEQAKKKEEKDKKAAEDAKKAAEEAYKTRIALYNAEMKLNETKFGTEWKYTEDGKKMYDDYFNYQLKHYSKNSSEYKNLLAQKLQYEQDYQKQLEVIVRAAGERVDTTGTTKTNNDIEDLKKQMDAELAMTGLTEEQKLVIRQSYEMQIAELRSELANNVLNAELDVIDKRYSYEKAKMTLENTGVDTSYKKEENDLLESLNQRKISYLEYTTELEKLDRRRLQSSLDMLAATRDMDVSQMNENIASIEQALQAEGLDDATIQALLDQKADYEQQKLEIEANYQSQVEDLRAEAAAREQERQQAQLDALMVAIDGTVSATQNAISGLASVADGAFSAVAGGLNTVIGGLGEMAKQLKSGQKGWKAYAQMGATALSGLSQMLSALGDQEDETTREGFDKKKKFSIASAVFSMLSGIVSVWPAAMELGPIAGPIVGAALSAMIAGIGAAQIAAIEKQQFDSSGGSSVKAANTSVNSVAAANLQPGVQYTQDVRGGEYASAIGDTKVYVTETDIAGAANRVNVQESENRY